MATNATKRSTPLESGNGAREALMNAVQASLELNTAEEATDSILLRLAADGFVIVPLEAAINRQ